MLAGSGVVGVANWPGGQPLDQCHFYAAFSNWALGFPDRALEQAQKGLAIAGSLSNPMTLLNAEAFTAALHVFRRDGSNAEAHARRRARSRADPTVRP